jgi:hypothetical protein
MFRELVRLTLCFLLFAGSILAVVVFWRVGVIFPALTLKLSVLSFFLVGCVLAVAGSAGWGLIHRTYHLVRGRRDREDGISCVACGRRAFPVEGTTRNYRCGICGCRFEGPEHF